MSRDRERTLTLLNWHQISPDTFPLCWNTNLLRFCEMIISSIADANDTSDNLRGSPGRIFCTICKSRDVFEIKQDRGRVYMHFVHLIFVTFPFLLSCNSMSKGQSSTTGWCYLRKPLKSVRPVKRLTLALLSFALVNLLVNFASPFLWFLFSSRLLWSRDD